MKKLNLFKFIIICIIITIMGFFLMMTVKDNEEQSIQNTEYEDSLFFEN